MQWEGGGALCWEGGSALCWEGGSALAPPFKSSIRLNACSSGARGRRPAPF